MLRLKRLTPTPALPFHKGEDEGGGQVWWVTGCRPNPPYIHKEEKFHVKR